MSRIQTRSRVLQIPDQLPPDVDLPIARQRFSWLSLLPIVLVTVAVAGGFVVSRTGGGGVRGDSQYLWAGHVPSLLDVDSDGVGDPVGVIRTIADDSAHLVAHSGTTGERLWKSESLGAYGTLGQQMLGSSGELVLIASERGTLDARDKTGKQRWQVSFSEKIDELCEGAAPGEVVVVTADKKWYVVDAEGKRRDGHPLVRFDEFMNHEVEAMFQLASVEPSAACVPISDIAWRRPAGLLALRRWHDLVSIPGMQVAQYIRRTRGPIVAVGSKTPGTSVPRLAMLDGATVRWSVEVPAVDPLVSKADGQNVTLSETAVFALYQPPSPAPPRLTAFEIASGKRLWDVALAVGRSFSPNGLRVAGDIVYVATWQGLRAYRVADGSERFLIGMR